MTKYFLDQYEDCVSLQNNVKDHPFWWYVNLAELIVYIKELAETIDEIDKKDFIYQAFEQLKSLVNDLDTSTEFPSYYPIHVLFRLGYRLLGLVSMDIAYVYKLGTDSKYYPIPLRDQKKDDILHHTATVRLRVANALDKVIRDTIGGPHHSYSGDNVSLDSGTLPFDLEAMNLYPDHSQPLPLTFTISELRLDLTSDVKNAWKTLLTEHDARQKLQTQREEIYGVHGPLHPAITKIDKTCILIDYLRYIYLDDIKVSYLGIVVKSIILQHTCQSNDVLRQVSFYRIDEALKDNLVYHYFLKICGYTNVNQ